MRFLLGLFLAASLLSTRFALAVEIPQDLVKQRDPFKMPIFDQKGGVKSELELFPADQFKLIGVLAGKNHFRAMISAPNGKTYFVKEQMTIGVKKGFIRKITEGSVQIREKTVNVLGQQEDADIVLDLPSDAKQDVKTITSEKGW